MQENFNNVISKYKQIPLENKKEILLYEIKEMIAVYMSLAEANNIPVNLLKSKEILDIKNNNYNEEDYIEAVYVYFNVLKEIISGILDNTMN